MDVRTYVISVPQSLHTQKRIDCVADFVVNFGSEFEYALTQEHSDTCALSFMFASDHPVRAEEHLYYRWRVHSLSQGDTLQTWRTAPFQQVVGGPMWVPPQLNSATEQHSSTGGRQQSQTHNNTVEQAAPTQASSVSEETERLDVVLSALQFLLRAVTLESDSVWSVSSFAVVNAEFARDIVSLIVESCCVDETPIPKKLARLYCLSDILNLSAQTRGIRNVSAYRSLIEAGMSAVCTSWQAAFQRGMMETSSLPTDSVAVGAGPVAHRYVLEVIETWKSWSAYPESTIQRWTSILTGTDVVGGTKG